MKVRILLGIRGRLWRRFLPWWSNGQDSCFPSRRCGFDSRVRLESLTGFHARPVPLLEGGGVVSFHPGWAWGQPVLKRLSRRRNPSQGEGLRRLRGTVKIRRARRVPHPLRVSWLGVSSSTWRGRSSRVAPGGAAPAWTGGRVVYGYCLENSRAKAPWVRIPPRPLLCWCAFPVSRRVASHDSAIMGCIR